MEIAGGVVGIVGLADLYSACKEAIEAFNSYRHFESESRYFIDRFNLDKYLLQRWANYVEIADSKLNEKHHTSLDDRKVKSLIKSTLFSIQEIFTNIEGTSSILQPEEKISNLLDFIYLLRSIQRRLTNQNPNSVSILKRNKFKWALGKKATLSTQIGIFGLLVDKLHSVISISELNEVSKPGLRQWMNKLAHSLSDISA